MEEQIANIESEVKQLKDVIRKMVGNLKENENKDSLIPFRRSENIKDLLVSLVDFQKEVESIEKSSNNPFYNSKYANLDDILTTIRPILAKFDLCITQFPISGGNNSVSIKTVLWHSSGQFMESDSVPIKPSKLDIQGYGATETYSKRYALGSLLQLSFCEDDDGNSQVKPPSKKNTSQDIQSTQPKRSGRI
ncbi:TPA: ERF family protein [Clostridioides difficile]|uniref:ERF family protein n=1 Tax=Clostridioides difficile TaxID=1496 RepID=UPI0009800F51|nr:ERF family protein [Clostridioides difficile]EGT5005388.1 recombination protein [Clostridioides difficile]EKG0777166.1 ERF family protein [Clostridioides difficile]EKG0781082.1 ERF family protein [Clostridioides difficile]EKG0813166.1 ERF family protein [Clostridioides difficile]MBH6984920.1 ERF family protein [Clostridioides difficile]